MKAMSHRSIESDPVGMVARDLREPIVDVLDRLDQVLLGVEPLTPRQRDLLTSARERSRQMRDLVDDVQDVARFRQGSLRPVLRSVDMRSVVREAIERAAVPAGAKSIELVSELPGSPLAVSVDRAMILQLFDNLISNALKFSKNGTTVRIGARRTATGVEAWVSDQGQGIHGYDLPHLFRRVPPPLGVGRGTGLGLFIVAEVLRLHRGTIRVMTEPGRGSTFLFELPRRIPRTAEK